MLMCDRLNLSFKMLLCILGSMCLNILLSHVDLIALRTTESYTANMSYSFSCVYNNERK